VLFVIFIIIVHAYACAICLPARAILHIAIILIYIIIYRLSQRVNVTETPAGISTPPLRYRLIPLSGAPVSAHGRAACHPIARVCVPLAAAVTRVTCTCPARRGCHSCDGEPLFDELYNCGTHAVRRKASHS